MRNITPLRKEIGDIIFYIHPFPALTAANISGELTSLLSPILVSLAPAIVGALGKDSDDDSSILDVDIESATPAMIKAFSSLSGDKIEKLMLKLLVNYSNVSYEERGSSTVRWVDKDALDELFTGDISDMFTLAIEVIKFNFKGFFKNLGDLSGIREIITGTKAQKIMDNLTAADSPTLS